MFKADAEKRLKQIDKELKMAALIDAPGSVLVGVGLYGKFGANGDAFLPFLNNQNNVNIMLLVGGAIMAWGVFKLITLTREKTTLKNEHNH